MSKKNNLRDFMNWYEQIDKNKRKKYIVICLIISIMVILFLNIGQKSKNQKFDEKETVQLEHADKSTDPIKSIHQLEQMYERNLQEALQSIKKYHNLHVMVNIDSSYITVYEKNRTENGQVTTEKDTNGGERNIEEQLEEDTTIFERDERVEKPVYVQTKKPNIRGVLIVVQEILTDKEKADLSSHVAKWLDISRHRVSVISN
ncbi:MAG TPA: hypothetical protein VK075_05950 [Pseudogracilibacillus sp.]|nr:hypothetical protein [Pseudogracilibacillus sp.]